LNKSNFNFVIFSDDKEMKSGEMN